MFKKQVKQRNTKKGIYDNYLYNVIKSYMCDEITLTELNGNVYSGSWRTNLRHGQGLYTSEGEMYDGQWQRDKKHGHGKWTSLLGTYEGQWKKGYRHKKGTHTFPDGAVYKGGWSKGKRAGFGVFTQDTLLYKGFWLGRIERILIQGRPLILNTKGRLRLQIKIMLSAAFLLISRMKNEECDLFNNPPKISKIDWLVLFFRCIFTK